MGVACIDSQLKYRHRCCQQASVRGQDIAPVCLDFIITDGDFFCFFAPFLSFNKLNIGCLANDRQTNGNHDKIDQIYFL